MIKFGKIIENVNYVYPKFNKWYEASDGKRFQDIGSYLIHEKILQQKLIPEKKSADWIWWWIVLGAAYLISLL